MKRTTEKVHHKKLHSDVEVLVLWLPLASARSATRVAIRERI